MPSMSLRPRALVALFMLCSMASAPALTVPVAALDQSASSGSTTAGNGADAVLAKALNRKLQGLQGLDGVRVTVNRGVALIAGDVPSARTATRALDAVKAEPGVVTVDNAIEVRASLRDRIDGATDLALDKVERIAGAVPLFLVAVLLVLVANWIGRVLGRRLQLRRLNHGNNPYFEALVRRLMHAGVLIVGVILALELMDWTGLFGALVGSAGVMGLIIGFAFKDIAENYVAGILLSIRRPFKPGDHIVIEKFEGKVVALTSRSTVLMTLDGNRLSLPNALVFKSVLLNYSDNAKRRFDFDVTIDPDESIGTAQALGLERIVSVDGVLTDPAPSSLVQAYAPSGSVLRFFGWIDQTGNDLGKVRTEALRAVKGAYAEAGIELPRSLHYIVQQGLVQQQRDHAAASSEPEHTGRDTSVNHDIDTQMATAQSTHSGVNLL